MKIRNGFVSNSSSSSFICSVCGCSESGMDVCLSDIGMYECENGHLFCEGHADINMVDFDSAKKIVIETISMSIIKNKKYLEKIDEDHKYYNDYIEIIKEEEETLDKINKMTPDDDTDVFDEIIEEYEFRYSVPSILCPICNLDHIRDDDMVEYIIKNYDIDKKKIESDIRSNFASLSDLTDHLKEDTK